jgi:hypothetical protein
MKWYIARRKYKNRHIKVIKDREYWYESIRDGDRVKSKYLGRVNEGEIK